MARRSRRDLGIDIRPALETLGYAEVIRQMGEEELIRHLGAKKFAKQVDVKAYLDNLPAAKRRELKRLLAEE